VSCGVGFQQNLGQKSVMDPSCQHNFWGHQKQQGHNKQESTTFILPYGSNKQHCMDKEEFHLVVFGVLWGWFSAKLGSKISEGDCLFGCSLSVSSCNCVWCMILAWKLWANHS
jgi:hypothetical protein